MFISLFGLIRYFSWMVGDKLGKRGKKIYLCNLFVEFIDGYIVFLVYDGCCFFY